MKVKIPFEKSEFIYMGICILIILFLVGVFLYDFIKERSNRSRFYEESRVMAAKAEMNALSSSRVGERVEWRNYHIENGFAWGVITIIKDSRDDTGALCREYLHMTYIREPIEVRKTACPSADGHWEVVNQSSRHL